MCRGAFRGMKACTSEKNCEFKPFTLYHQVYEHLASMAVIGESFDILTSNHLLHRVLLNSE